MQRPASLALASIAFATATALATPASAQGTMTPAGLPPPSPPPPSAEPAPTPTQPPVYQQASPAPESEPPVEEKRGEGRPVPPARTGFQITIRAGGAVPFGEVDKGEKISDTLTPQFSLISDIGYKIIPNLFIGGYVGIGVGGAGDKLKASCDQVGVDCLGISGRIGIQVQLHIAPEARWNPWVGYGIGYELGGVSGSKGSDKLSAALGGVEYGHFMGGLDYRISRLVGIGPFADFAVGQYAIASVEVTKNGVTNKTNGDLQDKSLHEWLTLGAKLTFYP